MGLSAKELFGRTVKTAVATKTCVSCKRYTDKSFFDTPEGYKEFKEDGLCHACVDELNSPVSN